MIGRAAVRRTTTVKPALLNARTGRPREDVAGGSCDARVDGIGLDGWRSGTACMLNGTVDKHRHHALTAKFPTNVEAGQRPDGQVVDRSDVPLAAEPVQLVARGKPTPSQGSAGVVERQESGRRSAHDGRAQLLLVLLPRPLVVVRTQNPIHAPAAVGRAATAEEIFECRPQFTRHRPHGGNSHQSSIPLELPPPLGAAGPRPARTAAASQSPDGRGAGSGPPADRGHDARRVRVTARCSSRAGDWVAAVQVPSQSHPPWGHLVRR